eukprot:CAMPEP_0174253846 /NCGR_PEP_ID=MMETSP0439-20130205/3210_1 /TAXON_ID=0 /ORGANISM="Stereomyxa ramosa, Strain Chinc5" /LENGTH=341 /DNA_ID=CAMNT_0015335111 /DNA_START=281 /DNA_END=1306 /DNA_ORIENTATION=-
MQEEVLSGLAKRIQEAIDNLLETEEDGKPTVFLKLDSRSPKDVVWEVEEIGRPLLERAFQERDSDFQALEDPQEKIALATKIVMRVLHHTGLCVSTGEEAVERIVRSMRCQDDLSSLSRVREATIESKKEDSENEEMDVPQHSSDQEYTESVLASLPKIVKIPLDNPICLRLFDWSIADSPWPEFRGFVHKNKLTAVSQYDRRFNKHAIEHREELEAVILDFFESHCREVFSDYGAYIIDFGLNLDMEIKVIELNSFESWTGACLFSWSTDREVILNGKEDGGVVFRFADNTDNQPDPVEKWKGLPIWCHEIASDYLSDGDLLSLGLKTPNVPDSKRCLIS